MHLDHIHFPFLPHPSSYPLTVLWDKVSHWAWILPFQLDSIPSLPLPHQCWLYRTCCHTWCFCMGLGILTQALFLIGKHFAKTFLYFSSNFWIAPFIKKTPLSKKKKTTVVFDACFSFHNLFIPFRDSFILSINKVTQVLLKLVRYFFHRLTKGFYQYFWTLYGFATIFIILFWYLLSYLYFTYGFLKAVKLYFILFTTNI